MALSNACTHLPQSQIKTEEIFNSSLPLVFNSQSKFKALDQLPGEKFNPDIRSKMMLEYDQAGRLILEPGDYVIPVLTFCLRPNSQSPKAYTYELTELQGKRSKMIREINLKALPKYTPSDVQILIWSLQSGLSYEEMVPSSQKIIDEVIPQFKAELAQSFLSSLDSKWSQISEKSNGVIPDFNESANQVFSSFAEAQVIINEMRQFRDLLKKVGDDYESLRGLVDTSTYAKNKVDQSTKWSQISDLVYARFVTDGHFQEIGFIELRIISQQRVVNSEIVQKIIFDHAAMMADPKNSSIQPLSFSTLYGYGGTLILPSLAISPRATLFVLLAILSAKIINWDDFFKLHSLVKDSEDLKVKKALNEGLNTLSKELDSLEKPLKEAGIVSGKSRRPNERNARQHDRAGGDRQLEKDFEKLPEEKSFSKEGKEIKLLPNGSKAIKRLESSEEGPTLEIQPADGSKIRIKVRYSK